MHSDKTNEQEMSMISYGNLSVNYLVKKIWEGVINSSLLIKKEHNNKNYPQKVVTYTQGNPYVFSSISSIDEVKMWNKKHSGHGILHYSSNDNDDIKEFLSNFLRMHKDKVDVYGTVFKDEEKDICNYFIAIHWKEDLNREDRNMDSENIFNYVDVYLAISKKENNEVYLNYFIVIPEKSLEDLQRSLLFSQISTKLEKYNPEFAQLIIVDKIIFKNQGLVIKSELDEDKIKDYLERVLNCEEMVKYISILNPEWINISMQNPSISLSSRIKINEKTNLMEYITYLKDFASRFGKKITSSIANALDYWRKERENTIRSRYV